MSHLLWRINRAVPVETQVLASILVVDFLFRFALATSVAGMLGVDGGAYGLGVNAVLGNEPTGAGFPRPPLAPGWLLAPFWELLGPDLGYKLWSALASIPVIIPVWLISRRLVGSPAATFATVFLSLDLLHAEMIVTGALPLLAFTFLGLAWYAMMELSERFSKRYATLLICSVAIIPWINQTTAGLALVTLPALWLALFCQQETWMDRSDVLWNIVPAGLLGGLLALLALPWYLDVLPVSGVLNYPGPWIFFTNPFDSAWWQFALAWGLCLMVFRASSRQDYQIRAIAALLPILGTLLVFLSTDETIINIMYRSRYLLSLPFYPCVAWMVFKKWVPWLRSHWPQHGEAVASLAMYAMAIIMAIGFIWNFFGQADYSAMITPHTARALKVYEAHQAAHPDPEHKGIINNSFTLALWIAALERVQAPHIWNQKPPVKWQETDKDVRCILGWVPGCDYQQSRDNLGVGFVLIEHRFPFLNKRVPGNYGAPPNQWEVTASTPWLDLIFESGTVKLWRIQP